MGNKWTVDPTALPKRVDLTYNGEPFWVEFKRELTIGEKRYIETGGFKGMTGFGRDRQDAEISIDWKAQSFLRTTVYLVDWSLADDHGNKIPLKNKRETVESLRPDVYEVIEAALNAWVEELEAEKKAQAGAPGPSATSA